MKLRFAGGSPFVRKVTVTAIETGLDGRIERVPTDPNNTSEDHARDNPLGRVPTLITDDGKPIIESSVICAYLDGLHDGPKMIPVDPAAQRDALWMEAMADGMTESAIGVARERNRPQEVYWSNWETHNWTKVERCLDALEANAAMLDGPPHIGRIAVACGLGWMLLRVGDKLDGWDARWPKLAAWYAAFCERPSMQATVPK
jgi:glutathione S-transferase